MATTIEQAIYPLLMTSFVLGLGVHSPQKLYLNILYNLTVWTAYSYLLYYTVIVFKIQEWFLSPVYLVNLNFNIFTSIASIILSIYQDKKFRKLIKRLEFVDDTLEELGTPKIYYKLHVYAKNVLIGWYIGTKFDNVNEHMKCLLIKEKHGLRRTWRTPMSITRTCITYTGNYKCVLWTSMHLHLELCQIARELNAMFGIQITLEMLAHLIHLTRLISYLFNVKIVILTSEDDHLLTSISWLDFQIWIWIYIVRLFGLNYICENVSAKANKTKKIIDYLSDFLRYVDVREEIHQFILQIIHHPLKFTGLNLFYFGNGFLQKFFTKVSTLVIILVQMSNNLSPSTSAENFKEK